jgi:tetratricopeptide (TPR) repeat protein
MHLPLGLSAALETGNCVLFLGSGIGFNLSDDAGDPAPTGDQLAKEMAEAFEIDTQGNNNLALVSQIVERRHGRNRLNSYLTTRLKSLEPDEDLRWLLSLTWKAIYTTNYDAAIERCYELNPEPTQRPVVISSNSEVSDWDPRFDVPVIHLHGSVASEAGVDSILITQNDYARFQERRKMMFEYFRTDFPKSTVLYVGYSHRDTNWQTVTADIRAEYSPNTPPTAYRIAPNTPALEVEAMAALDIETISGAVSDFRDAYEISFGNLRVEPHRLDSLKANIPIALHEAFEESPAAIARLLNSWEHLGKVDFTEVPNTAEFYKGDEANWALLGQGINFERDLEEVLHDHLLDFATTTKEITRHEVILGPAGYGMTTLLRAVAAWFAQERIGTILFLRSGMSPMIGDMEFAAQRLESPVIFVVDNAADYLVDLEEVLPRLRELPNASFLLMGERINEWRQSHPSMKPTEYELDALSDAEIDRLLDSLTKSGNLGRLAGLSAEVQFSTVKQRNLKELLVTMREVTEGMAFDAIVENEFHNIGSEDAKWLYGLVSAFSRVRALARDLLCLDASKLSSSRMLTLLREDLAGIVVWQQVDESRGLQALRARHRVIAEIVWERCLDRLEREELLLAALDQLNLAYGLDAKAFDAFTRDDHAVDSLQTLEAKTRFFEDAARKDPNNAYIRQHYARMLRREDRPELALSQIDAALKLSPHNLVIEHTRGVILRDMALAASSMSLGIRRLAQSEESFRKCIQQNPRDEFSYQSLAELYLDWARRPDVADRETVLYATKAQDVVLDGLQRARNREGLYVVDASIERFLGDTDRRIEALRNAWSEAPTSPIAPYLLGNVLRSEGRLPEALQVLEEAFARNSENPNLARSFALALHESGAPLDVPLAHLRLVAVAGERDPRFVAMYGGMLSLAGEHDTARGVWSRAANRGFSNRDFNRVSFVPVTHGAPLSLTGKVTEVRSTFSFIATDLGVDFFSPARNYSGITLRRRQVVSFSVGFSAHGPVAENVRPC